MTPGPGTEWCILGAAAAIPAIITMNMSSSACKLAAMSTLRAWGIVLGGSALVLAAVIATRLYLSPHVDLDPARLSVAAAALGVAVLVVPLLCLLGKTNYLKSGICVIASVCAGVLVAGLAYSAIGMVKQGDNDFGKISDRKKEHDRALRMRK